MNGLSKREYHRLLTVLFIVQSALIMTALLLLTASCSQGPQTKPMQENLLVKCPEELPAATGKTGADWIRMAVSWRSQYNECKTRQHGLIEAVKERQDD